jgi:hypothetical protein
VASGPFAEFRGASFRTKHSHLATRIMFQKRRRSLTIPLSNPQRMLWRRQKTTPQLQCIFFCALPLELRQIIYALCCVYPFKHSAGSAYRGAKLHITSHHGRLYHRPCRGLGAKCRNCGKEPSPYFQSTRNKGSSSTCSGLLAFMLTCRQR